MILSEFILRLQAIKEKHGDIEVFYFNNDYETGMGCEKLSIEICDGEACKQKGKVHVALM